MKESVKEGIDNFVRYGVPTGSFLQAVLENNLMEAFGRADDDNRADMFEIVGYVYNEVPNSAWGNPAKVKAWIEKKLVERAAV